LIVLNLTRRSNPTKIGWSRVD